MRSTNAVEGGNESHPEDNTNSFSTTCPGKIKFEKLLEDKKN